MNREGVAVPGPDIQMGRQRSEARGESVGPYPLGQLESCEPSFLVFVYYRYKGKTLKV